MEEVGEKLEYISNLYKKTAREISLPSGYAAIG
jgi:hypothetical protein